MGMCRLPAVHDYWRPDGELGDFDFNKVFTETRFEKIKGNLKVAPPTVALWDVPGSGKNGGSRALWHAKVFPLISIT